MLKYLPMLFAAALIASAPIYYAVSAQAEDAVEQAPVELSIDCTDEAEGCQPAGQDEQDADAQADAQAADEAAE